MLAGEARDIASDRAGFLGSHPEAGAAPTSQIAKETRATRPDERATPGPLAESNRHPESESRWVST
jgi:hypothetical protein